MKRWFEIIMNIAFVGTCLFLLWILALVFVFASFQIPSDSMSPELRKGDYVLVWKPVVGARLFNLNKSLNLEQTDIYRLPGFRKIKRNDVVVFNFPHPNDWSRIEMHIMKYYIKRCIGLPGDTVSIRKGMFKVDGVDIPLGNVQSMSRRVNWQTYRHHLRHSTFTPLRQVQILIITSNMMLKITEW